MARPARPLAEDTRQRLFRETSSALLAHGYRGASLNAVLHAAGVSKSSFYHRFADKQALVSALVEDRIAALAAHVELPDPTPLDRATYWPAVDTLLADLGAAAAADPRTLEAGRLLHLEDLPAIPAVDRMTVQLGEWADGMLARGRTIGCVDSSTPPDLQRSLVVSVATELDRWALEHAGRRPLSAGGDDAAKAVEDAHTLAAQLLRRLLAA